MLNKKVEVIMGISGSGKSTIGQLLAKEISLPFLDADDFHPKENILKMSRGQALDDDDRWPWLAAIAEYIKNHHRDHFVLACSALKKSYRDYLSQSLNCRFHFLALSREEAVSRLNNRKGHFMKSDLVDSQLNTLELSNDLNTLSAEDKQEQIIAAILQKLK